MATQTIPWAGSVPYHNDVPYGKEAHNINQFMNNEAIAPFIANLPGYQSMLGQQSQNAGAMLKGQIPQDVVNLLAQQSAERGVGSGVSQSPNSSAALLSALGLTSLDMQQKGAAQFSQMQQDLPVPELFNPASLWVPTVLGQQEKAAASAGLNGGKGNLRDGTYYKMGNSTSWSTQRPMGPFG
jgi:hypothetical protein